MEQEKFYDMLKEQLGNIRFMLGLLVFVIVAGNCGRSFDKSDEKLGDIANQLQEMHRPLEESRNALNRIAERNYSCVCPDD